MKDSSYFIAFFLLVSLVAIGFSLTFKRWEAIGLPLMLGTIILILSVIELRKELRRKKRLETDDGATGEQEAKTERETRRFYLVLGWIVGFALGTYVLGYLISMPIFAIAYLRNHGRSWLVTICFAAIVTAFIYGVFEIGFTLRLYRGLIWNLIF